MSRVASFKIESGINMPARRRRSRFSEINFPSMAVGDSVLLEVCNSTGHCHKVYKRVYSSIYKLLRTIKPEGKFNVGMIQSKEDPSKTDIRLWRVE